MHRLREEVRAYVYGGSGLVWKMIVVSVIMLGFDIQSSDAFYKSRYYSSCSS